MFSRIRQIAFLGVFIYFLAYAFWSEANYDPMPPDLRTAKEKWEEVNFDPSILKEGDLLMRNGKGFISERMRDFAGEGNQWSHSGIISTDPNGDIFVLHAIGGETQADNSMKRDPIEIFCHPDASYGFGIYRYDFTEEETAKFDSVLTSWYNKKLQFDTKFEMETDDVMYCSEMIYKAVDIVTNGKNFIPLSEVLEKPYVAMDKLYLNNHCNQIYEYNYE